MLADSIAEAGLAVPSSTAETQRIAVQWVTLRWRDNRDTRWAVATLAHLNETHLDFDLGVFIGLDDEWIGGWGRQEAQLDQDATSELERLVGRNDRPEGDAATH